jgi:hypothetical protein
VPAWLLLPDVRRAVTISDVLDTSSIARERIAESLQCISVCGRLDDGGVSYEVIDGWLVAKDERLKGWQKAPSWRPHSFCRPLYSNSRQACGLPAPFDPPAINALERYAAARATCPGLLGDHATSSAAVTLTG